MILEAPLRPCDPEPRTPDRRAERGLRHGLHARSYVTDRPPRIGPATRPGSYLAEILNGLRAARPQVEYAWDLCTLAEPPLEQQLGTRTAAALDSYFAAAYHELDEALGLVKTEPKAGVMSGSDDLIARAKESAAGFVVPDHWGEVVELEEGEGVFLGRYRGQEEDSRGAPVFPLLGRAGRATLLLVGLSAEAGDGAGGAVDRRHRGRHTRGEL